MNTKENLIKLLNTMQLVETKGESTVIQADCMRFLKEIISSYEEPAKDGDK